MTGYEIVITIVQFFTLAAVFGALFLSRKEYKARMRPYIGFEEIKMRDIKKKDEIEFDVYVKNVGQIPATNAKLYGEIIVTDEENITFECDTKGSVFPSSDPVPMWLIGIKEIDKDAILSSSKILQLRVTIDYYGVGKEKYQTSSSRTYDPKRNSWVNEEGNWI